MKETESMIKGGTRMKRATGLILALGTAFLAACASGAPGVPGVAGERPRDDAETRAASVALAQAALAEGPEAQARYEQALERALAAIERDPTNPRAYMVAGQASVGSSRWVQADTMFARALDLYPGFADQIEAEREEGWVMAYNLGAEAMNDGEMQQALGFFRGADILYQARPEARLAIGLLSAQEGDTDAAIAAYRGALEILSGPPPAGMEEEQAAGWERDRQIAAFNLANLLAQMERYGDAADVLGQFVDQAPPAMDADVRLQALTARAAFLAQAERADEAEAIYGQLLGRGDLGDTEYFQIGIGLFNAGEYQRAADAFANAARLNPFSRDAHLNLVQSLYTAAADLEQEPASPARDQRLNEMYDALLEAAARVREFDPFNRNLLSFTLRAYRAKVDISPAARAQEYTRRSQEVFRDYQEMPYEVSDLTIATDTPARARIQGVLTNLSGTAGQSVGLRFTVLDRNGNTLDTATTQVTVPAVDQSVQFTTTVDLSRGDFAGWRYELVN
jgi:tetratricopeptide (TPR) repeat protein